MSGMILESLYVESSDKWSVIRLQNGVQILSIQEIQALAAHE